MKFTTKEEKILRDAKIREKAMKGVERLVKDIATLEKKLEIKKDKISELFKTLDYEKSPSRKRPICNSEENGKPEDPSVLFAQD